MMKTDGQPSVSVVKTVNLCIFEYLIMLLKTFTIPCGHILKDSTTSFRGLVIELILFPFINETSPGSAGVNTHSRTIALGES